MQLEGVPMEEVTMGTANMMVVKIGATMTTSGGRGGLGSV
jgi:hypothetical protein